MTIAKRITDLPIKDDESDSTLLQTRKAALQILLGKQDRKSRHTDIVAESRTQRHNKTNDEIGKLRGERSHALKGIDDHIKSTFGSEEQFLADAQKADQTESHSRTENNSPEPRSPSLRDKKQV